MTADVLAELSRPERLRCDCLIGGLWVSSDEVFPVVDPATENVIAHVSSASEAQVALAVAEAKTAQVAWFKKNPRHREALLNSWCDHVIQARDDLAALIVLEQGKPLAEALGEIDYAASFLRWFAAETRRGYGRTIPSHFEESHLSTRLIPVGVAALVTPWNFPAAMLTRKAGAALAAGCGVVAHPSPETPLTALALGDLAVKAGFPSGLMNILPGDSKRIVGQLCDDPRVGALSFTGSTEIGSLLLSQSASTVKKVSMELGGHAPFIGFSDYPLSDLVDAAINAKFQTSGQDCLAANRILIEADIYEDFIALFAERIRQLRLGNGFDAGVQIGPLQNRNQVLKSARHFADAVSKGARAVVKAEVHDAKGYFHGPALVADVDRSMDIWQEETFGPVAGVSPFSSMADAVTLANDTQYGLAAYVFSNDIGKAIELRDQLEFGMVAINRVSMTGPEIPFGGTKLSGIGREGADQGMLEFMESRYCCMQIA